MRTHGEMPPPPLQAVDSSSGEVRTVALSCSWGGLSFIPSLRFTPPLLQARASTE